MNNQHPLSYTGPSLSALNAPDFAQRELEDAKQRKHARNVEYHAIWQLLKRIAARDEYQSLDSEARKAMLEQGVLQLRKKRLVEGKAVGFINADEMIHRHLNKPSPGASGSAPTPLGPPLGDYHGHTPVPYGGADFSDGYALNSDFPGFDFNSFPVIEDIEDMHVKPQADDLSGFDELRKSIVDLNSGGPVGGLPRLPAGCGGLVLNDRGRPYQLVGPISPGLSVEECEESQPDDNQENRQQQAVLDPMSRLQKVERDLAKAMQMLSEAQVRIQGLEEQGQQKVEGRGEQRRHEGPDQKRSSSGTVQGPQTAIDLS